MKRYWHLLIIGIVMLTQTSCTVSISSNLTKGEAYAKMYEEKPVSILVMPPINNTNNVEAKDLLYTSISQHIAEAGYYVVSPVMAMEVFKNESAYDAEYFIHSSLRKFKEYFGADAIVFAVIDKWAKEGFQIHTDISYIVKSTTTNEILFERSCDMTLNLMKSSNYGNGLAGALAGVLVDVIVSAIDVATTEHIEAARIANMHVFKDLPFGKYSPLYLQDKELIAQDKHMMLMLRR